MLKKCLFLDRDGVINVDKNYVYKIEDFKFIDGIFVCAKAAILKNYLICVITNQAGIGRGYYTVEDFELLTSWMCQKFCAEDIPITKVYFSPYHPVHGVGQYKKEHVSRKPNPGMILQAASELGIDLSCSVLIGDKASDLQAGHNAGIKTNIYFGSEDSEIQVEFDYYRISHLEDALTYI